MIKIEKERSIIERKKRKVNKVAKINAFFIVYKIQFLDKSLNPLSENRVIYRIDFSIDLFQPAITQYHVLL